MTELPTRSKAVEMPPSEEVSDLALDNDVRTALIEISYGQRLMFDNHDVNAMMRGLKKRGIGFKRIQPVVPDIFDSAEFPGVPLS